MRHSTTSLILWGLLMASTVAWGGIKVEIRGIEGELLKNARAYLTLERLAARPDFREEEVRWAYRLAPKEIRQALQALGYYHPKIQGTLERKGKDWVARFEVQPGPPVKIAAVDFLIRGEGAEDPAFRAFSFPLKVGDVLRHDLYERAKKRLLALAAERGYFDAGFTEHRIEVDVEKNQARVVLHFYTGPRYRFGPVIFHQEGLGEHLLYRFVPFSPGEPYDASKLIAFQEALVKSGYFASVDVRLDREHARDREVPVEVFLKPLPRFKFSFGLGYATDTGARGSLGFENRRINRRGHRLKGTLLASQRSDELNLDYEIPGRHPLTERWLVGTGFKDERTKSATSRLFNLGVRRSHGRMGWLETLFLDLQRETFE
ncbi:MAG: outer membrane protein assembly factor, partial [Gammaproteobacteria bacterium]